MSPHDGEMQEIQVAYLALQAPREGTASHAHVHEIIRGLEKRQIRVRLYSPQYDASGPPARAVGRLRLILRSQMRMWRRERTADLLYVRSHFAAFPSYLWARFRGVPVIREINGPYQDLFIAWPRARRFRPFIQWMMRSQLRWSSALVAVTSDLGRWAARESDGVPTVVIPNGANADLFRPGAELTQDVPQPYVVFVGVLASWQGIDTILQALEHPEWPASVSLVVAGEGAHQPSVEQAAHAGRVCYLGRIPYEHVPGLLGGSIGALSPQKDVDGRSATGLYPLKVFEAMGCAVPIVVTDHPGQGELVREVGCGLVIPPEDSAALARAVAGLAASPERRAEMGSRGREALVAEHSWDARAAATARLIFRCVSGGPITES